MEKDKSDYCVLGIHPTNVYIPSELILETSVVVDIDRFFYNPESFSQRQLKSLINFLIDTKGHDVVLGYGIYEACQQSSKRTVNKDRLERMVSSVSTVLNWSEDDIRTQSSLKIRHQYKRQKPLNKKATKDSRQLLRLAGYSMLLKIQLLSKQMKNKQGIQLFGEFTNWVEEFHGAILVYELQLAIDYFLGNRERKDYVQKIMKFGKKDILKATWSAAWDLFFIRLLVLGFAGKLTNNINEPALVTRDKGLIAIRNYCWPVVVSKGKGEGSISNPLMMMQFDDVPKVLENLDDFRKISDLITKRQIKRIGKKGKVNEKQLNMLISKLEKELTSQKIS